MFYLYNIIGLFVPFRSYRAMLGGTDSALSVWFDFVFDFVLFVFDFVFVFVLFVL